MRRGPGGAVEVRDRADQEGEAGGRPARVHGAADGGVPPGQQASCELHVHITNHATID